MGDLLTSGRASSERVARDRFRIGPSVTGECWQKVVSVADKRALKRKGADYHHGDLRRSLVEATVRLVADHGVDGFTLRAAAKLAGVSDGAPYHHFADKEALLAAVAEESFELLCSEMNAAGHDHSGSPAAKAQAMCVAYVLFAEKYPARFRIMWSPLCHGRARHRGLTRSAKRAERLLHQCLDQGLRRDPNRSTAERSIMLARAFLHGLSFLAIDGQLKDGPNEKVLKRAAWEALRQLNPGDHGESEPLRQQGKATPVPESAPRSGHRIRRTRQTA